MTNQNQPGRKTGVIGCMIRKGTIPGGFTRPLATSRCETKRRSVSMAKIKEAANVALARRGLGSANPSAFEATQYLEPKP